ncbi:cyclin-dependent kinase 2-associated protein 1 isoform X2 [Tupaia chinensis]|uniref:cyclin-dependent kinase 2-associated protein 1 isoform X2 n=1 Tax=Tupaia chinensis TaxID=246437 RepID=UPI000703EF5A|nr:cyclin-dependent kinase 2-associated protein 1 isoform X2 [Tupaia chinensis]
MRREGELNCSNAALSPKVQTATISPKRAHLLRVRKPDKEALLPAGSVHSPSTSMATSSQYRQLLSDYGPPSLGYTQGAGSSRVPQSKGI